MATIDDVGQRVHFGRRPAGAAFRPRQTVHVGQQAARSPAIVAVSGVLLFLFAPLLTGCSGSSAHARTVVVDARAATLVSPGGDSEPAQPDGRVAEGTIVRTARGGAAILDTGGRMLYLGGATEYVVGTGVSGELRTGAAVVDARHGPDLDLAAGQVAVRTDASAVRVERGFSVRVGVFSGTANVATVPGTDDATVEALHQVVVAGRRIPQQTPLVLTDDDAEQRVALALVQDDERLNTFARALDRSRVGRQLVSVAAAADFPGLFSTATVGARSALPLSEYALPVAIARAAVGGHAHPAQMRASYADVRGYRSEGGSWGVVAHLVGTDADATAAAMNILLPRLPAAGASASPGGGPTGGPGSPGGPSEGPGSSPTPGHTSPSGGPEPSPTPRPTPTPSSSMLDDLVGTVSGLVSPSPTPSKAGTGQSRPRPSQTCLILGLVCS